LKKNINPITSSLENISNLNPVSFDWDKSVNMFENRDHSFGLIAQDLSKIFPYLVHVNNQIGTVNNVLSIDYTSLIALCISGNQELSKKINDMEDEIKLLKSTNTG
jgi:hypothetical protein